MLAWLRPLLRGRDFVPPPTPHHLHGFGARLRVLWLLLAFFIVHTGPCKFLSPPIWVPRPAGREVLDLDKALADSTESAAYLQWTREVRDNE